MHFALAGRSGKNFQPALGDSGVASNRDHQVILAIDSSMQWNIFPTIVKKFVASQLKKVTTIYGISCLRRKYLLSYFKNTFK
jgi:hypothetical protein